jgi:hypothetical protein
MEGNKLNFYHLIYIDINVHLIGLYLIGLHLIDLYFIGVCLIGLLHKVQLTCEYV